MLQERVDFSTALRRLEQAVAERLGKDPSELRPWVDYDPIILEEEAYHISQGHGSIRWTGD